VEGPDAAGIVDALCALGESVAEVDITSSIRNADARSRIAGPLPPALKACFPRLHQCEWSYNSLDGPLPEWIVDMPNLSYFKQRANKFSGPIPPSYGTMTQLFRLDLGRNALANAGPAAVPATFAGHPSLGIFQIDGNAGLTGHVLGLAGTHLQVAALSPNAGLCGPVPSAVRWAVGFNSTGTRLGSPCPGGYGYGDGDGGDGGGSAPDRAPGVEAAGGPPRGAGDDL
jgi:hypothetical protein